MNNHNDLKRMASQPGWSEVKDRVRLTSDGMKPAFHVQADLKYLNNMLIPVITFRESSSYSILKKTNNNPDPQRFHRATPPTAWGLMVFQKDYGQR